MSQPLVVFCMFSCQRHCHCRFAFSYSIHSLNAHLFFVTPKQLSFVNFLQVHSHHPQLNWSLNRWACREFVFQTKEKNKEVTMKCTCSFALQSYTFDTRLISLPFFPKRNEVIEIGFSSVRIEIKKSNLIRYSFLDRNNQSDDIRYGLV